MLNPDQECMFSQTRHRHFNVNDTYYNNQGGAVLSLYLFKKQNKQHQCEIKGSD